MIPIDDTPAAVPVVTPQLLGAFERLALVAQTGDAELALAAMDADLLLRASLPLGAVETAPEAALAKPTTAEPVALAMEAVDMLDRHADLSESAAAALMGVGATERLTGVLFGRRLAQQWLKGRVGQEESA